MAADKPAPACFENDGIVEQGRYSYRARMPGKAGTGEPANGGSLGGRPLNAEVDRDLVK